MAQYTVMANGVTLTGAATQSLILLDPVTDGFRLTQISISLDNVTTDAEPVQFDLYRTVTLGTPAGTSSTPVLIDPSDHAATTTALINLTTEPTSVSVIDGWYISPHSGLFVLQFPLDMGPRALTGAAQMGLRYVTAASVTPKCNATLWFDEQ